jgi:outer membrane protein assembly factor BamB
VNADVALPRLGLKELVVDPVHGHIFMSGGQGTTSIIVTDLDGSNLRTIDNVGPGAWGMALSQDGSRLYVAASDGDEIAAVDTATLRVKNYYWTGNVNGVTCPNHLAETPGQLWFSWGCDGRQRSLGRIDLTTAAHDLNVAAPAELPSTNCPARLMTEPSQPDVVIAGERCSPGRIIRYRVSDGGSSEPGLVREAVGPERSTYVSQMAFIGNSNGSEIVTAHGSPYYHPVLRTSDLTEVRRYTTINYPNAVASRDDGLVAAGVDNSTRPDIMVFDPGATTPRQTFDFSPQILYQGSLAVHGMQLFAVSWTPFDYESLTLHIRALTPPPPTGGG